MVGRELMGELYSKQKRIVNTAMIESLKELTCYICGYHIVDVHHLNSKGSGGDDIENNLITLCRKHHSELHQIGLKKFSWKYPRIKEFLTKMNRFDLLDKIYEGK